MKIKGDKVEKALLTSKAPCRREAVDANGVDIPQHRHRSAEQCPLQGDCGKVRATGMDGQMDGRMDGWLDDGFVVLFGEISSGSSTAYWLDSCEHVTSSLFSHVQGGNFVPCIGAGGLKVMAIRPISAPGAQDGNS